MRKPTPRPSLQPVTSAAEAMARAAVGHPGHVEVSIFIAGSRRSVGELQAAAVGIIAETNATGDLAQGVDMMRQRIRHLEGELRRAGAPRTVIELTYNLEAEGDPETLAAALRKACESVAAVAKPKA